MLRFTLKRSGQVVLTLAILAAVTFAAIHAAPGGPSAVLLGADRYTPELEAEMDQILGLDRPVPEQLVRWMAALVQGELGRSYFYRRPAAAVVGERLPNSVLLGGLAFVTSVALGVSAGVYAAMRRGGRLDRALSTLSVVFLAIPSFWLGITLIVVFAAWLRLLPSAGMAPIGGEGDLEQRLRYLALPLVTMALPHAASLALYTRTAMVQALVADYARTAYAKGAGAKRVAWRHALPNAAISVVTLIGLNLPHIVEGSVVVETVFAWPGIGQLTVASVGRRDYPVLMTLTLLIGLAVVLANFIADLLYHRLDPRIGYE